ncbi:MAG: MFS transporter [Treponema sp.]|jgi:fucose permease|nr:MFS transporter [Treponema sp.]
MQQKTGRAVNAPIIALLVCMYAIVAMSDNYKGIFVPTFKESFHVSNTKIGYLMTVSLLAYAVFQYFGGMLIEKLGYKRVILTGSLLAMTALTLIVFCNGYLMLLAGMFVLNAGMALFNVTVSTLGPALTVASTAILMNMIVASYSASNTVLQQVSGILLAKGISWQSFYAFMFVCLAVLCLWLMLIKIPYRPQVSMDAKPINKNAIFKNKMLYLYVLVAAFYLGTEYGMGSWLVNYMSECYHLAADERAIYMTIFVGIRTVSLLLGGFVSDRLGLYKSIMVYAGVGTVLLGTGIAMGQSGLIIISIGGVAFAVIFPAIISSIKTVFRESTSYATGFILMGGTLGAMCISTSMGVLNDVIGAQNAFYLMPLCMLMTLVMTLRIRAKTAPVDKEF